ANETFSYKYSNKGDAIGLLKNLKLQVIATQGAPEDWYLWGNHVKYLEETFKFLGLNVNESILIAGTKTKEFALKSKEEHWLFKKEEIIEKAKKF
ncbi:NAD(P)H-dependent oxidoreductase, partial [Metamycoplasma cloacale]